MSVESDEDREMMLDPEDFGTELKYDGNTIFGIFDEDAFMVDDGVQSFTTKQISVLVRTKDVPGILIDSKLEINGTGYKVKDKQDDSTGMIDLMLYIDDGA